MNGFISNYMGVPCLSTSSLFCLIHQWVSQWLLQDLPSSNWNKYLHDFSNTGREKIIHNDCSYLFFSWNCMIMAACVGETVNCIALSSNSNSNWFQPKPFQKERELHLSVSAFSDTPNKTFSIYTTKATLTVPRFFFQSSLRGVLISWYRLA